jgi:hypothetical protein
MAHPAISIVTTPHCCKRPPSTKAATTGCALVAVVAACTLLAGGAWPIPAHLIRTWPYKATGITTETIRAGRAGRRATLRRTDDPQEAAPRAVAIVVGECRSRRSGMLWSNS